MTFNGNMYCIVKGACHFSPSPQPFGLGNSRQFFVQIAWELFLITYNHPGLVKVYEVLNLDISVF